MSCCIPWLACDVEVSRGRMRRGCRGKSLAVARQHCILASLSESLHSGLARKRRTEGWKTIQRWLDLLFLKYGSAVLGAESMWLQVRWKQFD